MREKNVAASVHGKLRDIAKSTQRPLQELLVYYAIERFLYRLSVSTHSERFVLKGGLLLRVWDAPHSRPTKDIDFLCYGSNQLDTIIGMARDVCAINDIQDGLLFDSETVIARRIKEDADYDGVRLKFVGRLGKAKLSMQIDVGFGDTVFPAPSKLQYPTLLKHAAPSLRAYPPETVIAEKFEAMVMLGTLNSRMKDFYDIWLLARSRDFDGSVLARAIRNTFDNRKRPIEIEPIAFTPEFYDGDHAKKQWAAFKRNAQIATPETFSNVIDVLRAFLLPVASHLVGAGPSPGSWSTGGPWE